MDIIRLRRDWDVLESRKQRLLQEVTLKLSPALHEQLDKAIPEFGKLWVTFDPANKRALRVRIGCEGRKINRTDEQAALTGMRVVAKELFGNVWVTQDRCPYNDQIWFTVFMEE